MKFLRALLLSAALALSVPVSAQNGGPTGPAVPTGTYFYKFTGVNFNATNGTDIVHLVVALPPGASGFTPNVRIYNCSAAITSAHIGLFDGAGATGNTLVASTLGTPTASGPAAATSMQVLGTAASIWYNSANLFLNLIGQQGSAVTCNVTIILTFQ